MSKFCGNCGAQLDDTAIFCGQCGARTIANEPIEGNNTNKSKKTLLLITIPLVILVTAIVSIIIISNSKRIDYSNYESVLSACCEAINKSDKATLNNLVYDKLGNDWNKEQVINVIDNFREEYLPVATDIKRYEHYRTESEAEELQAWVFRKTGKIIEISEAMEIQMKNRSCLEICLMKVENRWYVLYIDL